MQNFTKNTEQLAESSSENVKCIVCGENVTAFDSGFFDNRFGIPGEWTVGRCVSCGIVQQYPCPETVMLDDFYKRYYNYSSCSSSVYRNLRERFLNSTAYTIWSFFEGDTAFHLKKGTGCLLDVGCNEGRGLIFYQKNGYTVEGIEINAVAASRARAKGFSVAEVPVSLYESEHLYDVIVLSQVLEHETQPCAMVEDIYKFLKTNGELWISVPNYQSIQRVIFGRWWINWHLPFHITFFTPGSLRELLEKNKLEIIDYTCTSPALWTAQSILSWLYAEPGKMTRQMRNPFMIALLSVLSLIFLTPLYVTARLLHRGDCIKVVARKTGGT